jgi:Protein of unknown function (DUF2892)
VTPVTDTFSSADHTDRHRQSRRDFLENIMSTNVGGIDRILRIVAGIVLLALTLTGTIGVWGWIGIVLLATGLFKFCPIYPLLGLNTCPLKAKN